MDTAYPDPGHELNNGAKDKTRFPLACQALCKTNPQCQLWTWGRNGGECWLKTWGYLTKRREEKSLVSGTRNACPFKGLEKSVEHYHLDFFPPNSYRSITKPLKMKMSHLWLLCFMCGLYPVTLIYNIFFFNFKIFDYDFETGGIVKFCFCHKFPKIQEHKDCYEYHGCSS